MDHVTGLHHLHHGALCGFRVVQLHHGLMKIRVQLFTQGIDFLDPVLGEMALQFLAGEFHAFQQL